MDAEEGTDVVEDQLKRELLEGDTGVSKKDFQHIHKLEKSVICFHKVWGRILKLDEENQLKVYGFNNLTMIAEMCE